MKSSTTGRRPSILNVEQMLLARLYMPIRLVSDIKQFVHADFVLQCQDKPINFLFLS